MRLVLLALCVIFAFANPPQAWGFQSSANSAEAQAAACANSDQHVDCEMYIRGFTDTVNEAIDLCGDTDASDLIAEFAQVARTNPHADRDKLLFNMLMENYKCSKLGGQIHNPVSAGALIDICNAGDIGFDLCSEYRAGFSNALFLFSKLTETQSKIKILCGDKNIASNSTIWLNNKLQADFRLRQQTAVKLMFDALKIHMPCPNHIPPPAEVRELMTQEEPLNYECAVGSRLPGVILVRPGVEDKRTDDASTQKACGERDALLQKIKAKNWCWGHDGQIEANRYWEPCTPLVPTPDTDKERSGTLPKERK